MDLITYEALYEILRNEKFNPGLQPIKKEFYSQITKYLKEKKAIIGSQKEKKDIFSISELQKTRKQLDNVNKIITEWYEIRERKIVDLALFSSRSKEKMDSANLTEEESQFFEEVKSLFDAYRGGILNSILEDKIPLLKEKSKGLKSNQKEQRTKELIRFTKTTPKFVAEDLNTYGPFDTEDVGNIPLKAARLLIKNRKAEKL